MNKTLISLTSLFLLPLIYFSLTLLGQFNHTLEKDHPLWQFPKAQLKKSVMGAQQFTTTRQALVGNHLNLSAWHGYHEIQTKDSYEPTFITFTLKLENGGYLDLSDSSTLIRFSTPSGPPALITAVSAGEFLQPLFQPELTLTPGTWHRLQLVRTGTTDWKVVDNDKNISSLPLNLKGQFSFHSNHQPSLLDSIQLRNQSHVLLTESFSKYPQQLQFTFLLWSCLTFALFLLLSRLKHLPKQVLYATTTLQIASLLCLVSLVFLDRLYFAPKYPKLNQNLKTKENEFVESEAQKVNRQVLGTTTASVRPVLFIGTSQTWGAGASTQEKTFTSQLQSRLQSSLPPECPSPPVIAAAISGSNSSELLDYFQNHWLALNPQLIFINLSHNDEYLPDYQTAFPQNLISFAQITKNNQIPLIFIKEANNPEIRKSLPLHPLLEQVGQEYQIPVIDLHHYLLSKNNSGMLWWDSVHLTDYGHTLAAEAIFPKLFQLVNDNCQSANSH